MTVAGGKGKGERDRASETKRQAKRGAFIKFCRLQMISCFGRSQANRRREPQDGRIESQTTRLVASCVFVGTFHLNMNIYEEAFSSLSYSSPIYLPFTTHRPSCFASFNKSLALNVTPIRRSYVAWASMCCANLSK